MKAPEFLISDFAKYDRPMQLHLGFQALGQFVEKNGRYPKPRNEKDAEEVLAATKALLDTVEEKPELDEKLIKELAYQSSGEISPMVAVYGGLAAQEVLKVCCELTYASMHVKLNIACRPSVASLILSISLCTWMHLRLCLPALSFLRNSVHL